MEIEKILFILFAIGFSIVSLYLKSKKQKQSSPSKNEEHYYDSTQQDESYYNPTSFEVFEQWQPVNLQQNVNISPKNKKTKQKIQDIETLNHSTKSSENILQNTDLENETTILKDFEGSELQKAFLFSEIFKNTKN